MDPHTFPSIRTSTCVTSCPLAPSQLPLHGQRHVYVILPLASSHLPLREHQHLCHFVAPWTLTPSNLRTAARVCDRAPLHAYTFPSVNTSRCLFSCPLALVHLPLHGHLCLCVPVPPCTLTPSTPWPAACVCDLAPCILTPSPPYTPAPVLLRAPLHPHTFQSADSSTCM